MNSGPVNSLSMDLMIDLRKAIKEATDDKDCAGIIIASSCRTFSAGLNMKELHGATPEHLGNFWKELQGEFVACVLCNLRAQHIIPYYPDLLSPVRPNVLAVRSQSSCYC